MPLTRQGSPPLKAVTQSIDITADAALVWDALTDRRAGETWRNADFKTDWQVGQAFEIVASIGAKTYRDKGIVLQADAPRTLKYAYWSRISGLPDIPEAYAQVTISLQPLGGGTVVTVEQHVPPSPIRRGRGWQIGPESGWKHVQFYWRMTLPRLKEAVERRVVERGAVQE